MAEPPHRVHTRLRPSRGELAWLAIIVGVAAALRLGWVLTVDTQLQAFSDPQWYFAVAKNLADGHGATVVKNPYGTLPGAGGFETLRWPVGYPLTLAAAFKLFGATLTTAKLVNAIAGTATVPLAWLLARRLFDARTGWLAAALMAVYPAHIVWSSVVYSDVLFTLPFVAAMVVVVYAPSPPPARYALVTGMLIGYASIIRPTALVLFVAVVAYWLARATHRRDAVAPIAAILAGIAIFAAPVAIWNSARSGSPKLLSENLGYNLRVGHAPYSTGRYITPEDLWATVNTNVDPSAIPSESLAIRRATRYAVTHPVEELRLSLDKLFYLYTTDSDAVFWASSFNNTPIWGNRRNIDRIGNIADAASYAVILLALASLPRTLTMRREMLFAWLVIVLWTAAHIVFFGEPRYRLPILPILLAFAAVSLVEIGQLLRSIFIKAADTETAGSAKIA